MKFRFCGDGDCPDWVLVEIHSTLSILSSVKLRILAKAVVQNIIGEKLSEEKLNEISSLKSAISCLRFLLTNAAKYNADEITFSAELQQLGLPKEHSSAICRVLSDNLPKIREKLYETRLKLDVLEDISYAVQKNTIECVQLNLKIQNEIIDGQPTQNNYMINIHKLDLNVLLNELKTIKHIIENYDYGKKYDSCDVKNQESYVYTNKTETSVARE